MAFIAVRDGVRRLYLRQLESGEATAVSGSEGAEYPLFSPDGQWVAFNANGSLLKVSATGGMPIVLCKAPDVRGLSWGDDGTIVFAPTYGVGGLARVADGGGQPHTLAARENDTAAEGYRWPQLLSPEKLVLFTAWTRNIDESEIIAQRLDTNERKVVLRGGTHARYLPSGQLLYLRAGTLMAVRFDPARMEAIGSPVPVMQGVSMTAEGGGQYDPTNQTPQAVSPDGQLLVFGNQPLDLRTVPLTAGGKPRPFIESPFRELGAAISPDSTAIAYASDESGRYEIYVQPFPNGGAKTQVSTDGGQTPRWSASGEILLPGRTAGGGRAGDDEANPDGVRAAGAVHVDVVRRDQQSVRRDRRW